jgi:hypothetical protein
MLDDEWEIEPESPIACAECVAIGLNGTFDVLALDHHVLPLCTLQEFGLAPCVGLALAVETSKRWTSLSRRRGSETGIVQLRRS